MTDAELIERARGGDASALEQLIASHQDRVYRFGLKMCRDPDAAEDVLQETLLAMARGIRRFRGASSLSTWLYTIARSYCIKRHRRSKFAPRQEASLETDARAEAASVADDASMPDEALAVKQLEHVVDAAIADLDPAQREVMILRDVEGLPASEVSEIVGIGVPAVKSRLHRARLAVRARVAAQLQPGADATPGPGCPDVLTLLSQHLEDEISADTCARMEAHLAGCPRCREACDSLRRTLALCRTAGASAPVPPAVQARVRSAVRGVLGRARD